MSKIVDQTNISEIAGWLAQRDSHLARIREQLGPPPLWKRSTGFPTLVRIVLEQQVSLTSAAATFRRLKVATAGRLNAKNFLTLDDQQLKGLGLSRQKIRYCRLLAERVVARQFSISKLTRLSDEDVRTEITSNIGFGNWSADIYLLMALCRSNILPTGDLGLVVGLAEVTGESFAGPNEIVEYAKPWEPYRSVGTRMIWQAYLAKRGKKL